MFSFILCSCTEADLTVYQDKFSFGTTLVTLTSPSLEQCTEECLADSNAYGGAWNSGAKICYFYYEEVNLGAQFTYRDMVQFVKAPYCVE